MGDPNVTKYRFCGEGDSSFMTMLLPFLFFYKVGDESTKAEAASETFALKAALGWGEGKVGKVKQKEKKAFKDSQKSKSAI